MTNNLRYCRSARRGARQGLALMVVLVCLGISVSLIATVTQASLMTQRRLRTEQYRRQATFLLQAGELRAMQQVARDPTYQGETWDIGADVLHGLAARITIQPAANTTPQGKALVITVDYPRDQPDSIRRSQTFAIEPTHS